MHNFVCYAWKCACACPQLVIIKTRSPMWKFCKYFMKIWLNLVVCDQIYHGRYFACEKNGGRVRTQAHASPEHYKSTQDTLLSNIHFLHYTQILQCLKDPWWASCPPWWASGPPLWASGPIHPPWHYKSSQDTLLSNFHFFSTPNFWTD